MDPTHGLAHAWTESPADVVDLYDEWASDSYDDDVARWGYEAPDVVAALVAEHLHDGAGTVLDAGCGTGRVGVALQAAGVDDIVGGDFSARSVEAARALGVYSDVDHLDLNDRLDFAADRFAAAVSVGVFTYLTDTSATLHELLRVVRPGGIVVFTQRTDLWHARGMDAILVALADAGDCIVTTSAPQPYLPGHEEFGDDIRIIVTTLTVPSAPRS